MRSLFEKNLLSSVIVISSNPVYLRKIFVVRREYPIMSGFDKRKSFEPRKTLMWFVCPDTPWSSNVIKVSNSDLS